MFEEAAVISVFPIGSDRKSWRNRICAWCERERERYAERNR